LFQQLERVDSLIESTPFFDWRCLTPSSKNYYNKIFEFLENLLYNKKKRKELISVEKKLLNSPLHSDEHTDSVLAEMFLNHALLEFRREKIRKEIDQTLLDGNKELFLQLTEELKKIS
jgi:uncharacterized protein YpiB (UPF0302 family)